jgi:uncharacterized iron-regulated protein
MKKIKFKGSLFLIIVIGIFSISIMYWNNSKSIISMEDYLSKNNSNVDLQKESYIEDFNIFNKDLKSYDVFLAGEGHSIAINYDMQLSLLKYLNKKAGVRYLLLEMAYSSSIDFQQYLDTGNENILKDFYDGAKGTASWSKESYEFWKKLRLLNETLPVDKKIRVIGVDMQYQEDEEIKHLCSSLPDKTTPTEIKPMLEALIRINENYMKEDSTVRKKAIDELKNDFEVNSKVYKEYLGDKYFDFTIILDTLVNLVNSSKENYNVIREECMYNNFKKIYSHFPKGKYFGQFGLEHVYQSSCSSYIGKEERFAMRLNRKDSLVKNRVLSMEYVYKDCFRMAKERNYIEVRSESQVTDIDILNKYAKTDVTIFNLKGKKTPFGNELHYVENPIEGHTLDYFQYIIFVKNSRGTIPLEQ